MENDLPKIVCKSCKKEFSYLVFDMRVPGGKDREYIYCPYCGQENGSKITSGWIETYKGEEKHND